MTVNTETSKRVLYTTERAAEYIDTKPDTMYRWRVQGVGPKFIKCQGFVRYDKTALDAWLDAGGDAAVA